MLPSYVYDTDIHQSGESCKAENKRLLSVQDVVTRGGKFVFLYKRPGKRVIVNDFGHFIVAPNSIKASIQQSTVGVFSAFVPATIASLLGFCNSPCWSDFLVLSRI